MVRESGVAKQGRAELEPDPQVSLAASEFGRPRRIGIAAKLNLLALGVLVATCVSVGVALVHMQARATLAEMKHDATRLAKVLGRTMEPSLNRADRAAIASDIAVLAGERDLAYAAVYGAGGELIAQQVFVELEAKPALALLRSPLPRQASASPLLEVLVPVVARTAIEPHGQSSTVPIIGHVRIGMLTARARQDAMGFIEQAARSALVLGALALGLTFLVTRRLVEPLRELALAAKQVGAGRLGLKIPVRSSDEVAQLAQSFQSMVDSLAASRARLLEYQSVLERRVEARTRELRRATAQALDLAQRDTLTGLANRAHFMERLAEAVVDAVRSGERMALLFIDLDHFKHVNDSLGHHAGDRLLMHVAQVLSSCVRDGDVVARLGGDEFVVLARCIESEDEVEAIVARLLAAMRRPIDLDGTALRGGFSIGVALCPDHSAEAADLLRQADLAMYAAKQSGRGAYSFYTDELKARALDRMQIEIGLRRALERGGELSLVYQPQLDTHQGHLHACEALLRWRQPDGTEVGPAEFIPVAEDSGLILEIGEFVLAEVCSALARWRSAGYDLPRVAINVAAPQFEDPGFCERVARVLSQHSIPPDRIELELTESLLLNDSAAALATMQELKALGVSLALDDFGTGYSSLAYLSKLPLDVLKIDRSFVMASTSDPAASTIVRSIIALAHSLGHDVVAEGVETGEQWGLLRRSGCDFVQGFFFSAPRSEAGFESWLRGPRTSELVRARGAALRGEVV